MLLLNELESLRNRAQSGNLESLEVRNLAESLASWDDIGVLLSIATGRLISDSQTSENATNVAYFEAGLSNFGDDERHLLERTDALELLLSVSPTMTQCVIDCDDPSAWRFLSDAAELERRSGGIFQESTTSMRALKDTLPVERLEALANGTASISDHLIKQLRHLSSVRKRARVLWQLKQYVAYPVVRDIYEWTIRQSSVLRWLCVQCVVFFSKGDINVERYLEAARSAIANPPNNSGGRVHASAESLANVIATCAIRSSAEEILGLLSLVPSIDPKRLTSLAAWSRSQIKGH